MIQSASQYPVHVLLGHESNLTYRVPPYQREYSWTKTQWEELFDDLMEADGAHFLGTIITLNQTVDAADVNVLELVDGQQRMTTLTLLLAAVHAILVEQDSAGELDREAGVELFNLGRRLVRRGGGLRLTPQVQGCNLDDYRTTLNQAGLDVQHQWRPYYPMRRMAKCFGFFREVIQSRAEGERVSVVQMALQVLEAVKQAILVKIEVASHADAFVLFESLNNRGMPLTPVDLIKNHLLATADRGGEQSLDEAFGRWNEMLGNLGGVYANHERFLRHYYNAFRDELPLVPNAPVATRTRLIGIYETILGADVEQQVDRLVAASRIYGRITCASAPTDPTPLDASLRNLLSVQGSPSYVLVLWLLVKREELRIGETDLAEIVDLLVAFFVRRNLTGYPQTYALPRLFMTTIEKLAATERITDSGSRTVEMIRDHVSASSSTDEEFLHRLRGPVYEDSTDLTRFLLTTLAEDGMTRETRVDLWARKNKQYVWTIEHILPQGTNLPREWVDMLGGAEQAAWIQGEHVHRLGNLTVTAYNSTLGNKSFAEKRDRTDSAGRAIGYRNGFVLNRDLAARTDWTRDAIEARTEQLAAAVVARFPLH